MSYQPSHNRPIFAVPFMRLCFSSSRQGGGVSLSSQFVIDTLAFHQLQLNHVHPPVSVRGCTYRTLSKHHHCSAQPINTMTNAKGDRNHYAFVAKLHLPVLPSIRQLLNFSQAGWLPKPNILQA